jgi:hypothetical protein
MTESATATVTATQLGQDSYQYSVTLTDTGTTPLGTLWFAWVPGQDFLDTSPTSVSSPSGWTDQITNFGTTDGYAIQWHVVATGTGEVAAGASLSGFSFTSADTPAQVSGDSSFHPGTPVLTSFVYSGQPFSDAGYQLVATEAACFAAGTRIATPEGDMPVEQLRPGTEVRLADGGFAAVVWLGRRRVDCLRHPRPRDVWPVRVRAGAFGPATPTRDLLLSPDHAVFCNGMLIPVRHLLNGRTVAQERVDAVTYWHVELARHDVLLAEGMPCESYLDTGNRAAFANGGGALQLHPDFGRMPVNQTTFVFERGRSQFCRKFAHAQPATRSNHR